MLKKLQLFAPVFVLISIAMDLYVNWADLNYRLMAVTASLGWLMYWDALNDLHKIEKEQDTDVKS